MVKSYHQERKQQKRKQVCHTTAILEVELDLKTGLNLGDFGTPELLRLLRGTEVIWDGCCDGADR